MRVDRALVEFSGYLPPVLDVLFSCPLIEVSEESAHEWFAEPGFEDPSVLSYLPFPVVGLATKLGKQDIFVYVSDPPKWINRQVTVYCIVKTGQEFFGFRGTVQIKDGSSQFILFNKYGDISLDSLSEDMLKLQKGQANSIIDFTTRAIRAINYSDFRLAVREEKLSRQQKRYRARKNINIGPSMILVDPNRVVRSNAESVGTHASPKPHRRRGHWMTLRDEKRYGDRVGKKIWRKAAWVGPKELIVEGNTYRILE